MSDDTKHRDWDWLEIFRWNFLKIPKGALHDVGPAAQTLGGLLSITNKETFVKVESIATAARLPKRTVEKHLIQLHNHGWIRNEGRGHTRGGRPRRTCTIKLTGATKKAAEDYLPMPVWLSWRFTSHRQFKWSERIVAAVIVRRMMMLESVHDEHDSSPFDWSSMAQFISENRFRFSLNELEKETSLSRPSIIDAKHALAKSHLIVWSGNGSKTDALQPNPLFRLRVTPAGHNLSYAALVEVKLSDLAG